MALRITGNLSQTDRPAADPQSLAATLAAAGRAALSADDRAGYHRQFVEAAAIDDPHRRHQAELMLLEQGLIHARSGTVSAAVRAYVAVAEAALEVLERDPCEPLLLSYAGVACYELWALDGARALFAAAARLDPALADVQRNRAELARRARGPRPRRPLHGSVPGLVRRARAVAERARPGDGRTLTLCMIVRDEEQMLGRCLEAARPAVDEIIVVDTGSTDATIEIARSFGATVIERPWTGSFAEARNASFDAATGDWLLYLDADEVLVGEDVSRLRELTSHSWREAFHLIETSFVGELGDGGAVVNTALRMFRNRPEYRFQGAIHEQIAHALPTFLPDRTEHTSVRVEHYGYLGDTRAAKDKSTRNLALLREQERTTETPTPFLHFNLGCEYAAAGEVASAVTQLTRAWELLTTAGAEQSTEYAPALLATLVRALRLSGNGRSASEWAATGLEVFPDFTDLVFEQAAAALDSGEATTASERLQRCLELGDAPARYGGMVGTGTFLPRVGLARLALDRGDAADAVTLLDWCLEHHPAYLGVTGPYVTARLAAGAAAQAVVCDLQERLTELTPSARVALARALAHGGAIDEAEAQYDQVLRDGGERTVRPARAALAEMLLTHGAWSRAAIGAARIPDDDPYAALACRIATAALIAEGDLPGARAARERAAAVGLAECEREVLDAWIDAAGGAPPRTGLSIAGVPLLATLLELMLRAGQARQSEHLRMLLEGSRLPARECTQLTAEIHLRRGDLAGAAAQWLAVCATEPDARARLGLAEVAAAGGMPEDAVLFAQAALELDAHCLPARALLDRLTSGATAAPALVGAGMDR